jgi:hypothetical protein
MKIDFDTLIYIIIMIVFIVLGALGKKKKPVQQSVPIEEEGEEEEYTSPEDVIAEKLKAFIGDYDKRESSYETDRSIQEESEPEVIRDEFSSEKDHGSVETYKSYKESSLDKMQKTHDGIQEGIPVFSDHLYDDKSTTLADGDLTMSENQPSFDDAYDIAFSDVYDDFDLTKAIIFSDILNRKHF